MKIKYFVTYDEAHEIAKTIPAEKCVNRFQTKQDTQAPKIVYFLKGYAVQYGDSGDYYESR